MVAHALDHGEGPAVAHGKTLPGHSAEVRLAARGAVEDDVAHQDVLLGHEGRLARRIDDELAAREALADVVVGIALEGQRDAPGHEGAEALARRAREVDADRVVGQAVRTMAPRQLRAQDRPHRAVDVADGQADVHGLAPLQGLPAQGQECGHVQRLVETVVLLDHPPDGDLGADLGPVEDGREVEPARLPVVHGRPHVEKIRAADQLVHGADPELGHVLAHLFGDEAEEGLHELGLARELGAELGVLGGDAHGARVEMADAHHDAAQDHEGSGGEPVLLGAQEGGDDHVAARLHLAVGLDDDAVAELVHDEDLLRLGQTELPRDTTMLDGGEGRGAGAAVVPRDEDHVGMGLGHPGRHRPHADLGHELDAHARPGIAVLEIVDELGQVLDRVDVVMRGRRGEPHPRHGMADLGDPRIDLAAGELAALAGLGALGHLDLQLVGVDEVLARHAEAARGDLLDGAAAPVAVGLARVARGILAALARVGLAAHAVHGHGQRLVGLEADGAVRHGPGGEALDDRLDGLDLLDGHGRPISLEREEAPERGQVRVLGVDEGRVLLEDHVLLRAGSVLELEDRVGVEEVVLPVPAPLVLAAPVQLGLADGPLGEGALVAEEGLARHHVQADPADARGRPGEVAVHEVLGETDGLEDLGGAIRLDGGDAHLRDDLEHALVQGLDVVLDRRLVIEGGQDALADHVVERLEGEIGIDGPRPVAEEQGHVVDLAGLARLDDEANLHPLALADQVVMHARGGEEGRDGRPFSAHPAIRDDEVAVARVHGPGRAPAQLLHGGGEAVGAIGDAEEHGDGGRLEARQVDVADARQLGVVEDGRPQLDLPAGLGGGLEQVALGPDARGDLGHQLLADAVEGRIGHLREQLLEVVVEQPRPVREHGERRVGAHGAYGLLARRGHGREEDAQVLVRVAEGLLPLAHGIVVRLRQVRCLGQALQRLEMRGQPLAVRALGGEGVLELGVVDDAPLGRVHEEDAAGVQALLDQDALGRDVEHAHFRRHDHEPVLGDVVARRTEAVAIQDGADDRAVREGDGGGAVPGLHEAAVVLVEILPLGRHGLVPAPCLRDHHEHGQG